jgi:hypothetical protein
MLWMLAQLYHDLPEAGDLPKPKLCFFFDEAHLLFDDASDALMEQVERTARLIRSKGVGVYFVTQTPTDIPAPVLAQLGNRVEHALRAFTPQDADDLKKTARTFPMTDFYDVPTRSPRSGPARRSSPCRRVASDPARGDPVIPPDSMGALDAVQFRAASRRPVRPSTVRRSIAKAHGVTARISAAKQVAADRAAADRTPLRRPSS